MTRFGMFTAVAALSLSLAPATAAVAQTTPPPAPARPARVRANLNGFDLSPQPGASANQSGTSKTATHGMAPNQIGGASRGLDGSVTLYAPRLGKSYSIRPVFDWNIPADSQRVKFQLMNNSGDVVYETTLAAGHLEYPSDAPALAPGETYRWSVQLDPAPLDPTTKPVSFIVVVGVERTAIAQQLAAITGSARADEVARAKVFADNHLWYDAVNAYTALIAKYPADASLRDARSAIYEQVGATQSLTIARSSATH